VKSQISPAVAVVVIIIVLVLLYVAWQLIYGKKAETPPPISTNMTLPATPDGSPVPAAPAAPVAPPAPPGG